MYHAQTHAKINDNVRVQRACTLSHFHGELCLACRARAASGVATRSFVWPGQLPTYTRSGGDFSAPCACDGATDIPGGAALGHPRVWLQIDETGYVDCGYCDRRFILIGGPADGADQSQLPDHGDGAGR